MAIALFCPIMMAYFLISHGSPAPEPQAAMAFLCQQLTRLGMVGWGTLEEEPLPNKIQEFSGQAQRQGAQRVVILPLFLLPGNHVVVDLPQAIASTDSPLPLELLTFLGGQPLFQAWLRQAIADAAADILLGHGSRRPEVHPWFEELCQTCGVRPALLTEVGSLDHAIERRMAQGYTSSKIYGYFLFGGKTVDQVHSQLATLQVRYPHHAVSLVPAIQPTSALINVLQDILQAVPLVEPVA
ncbi:MULTISPECIES: CbiX/SirB N-terminal domain-containing protein [unclassified Thermosynechococcus]|uniref:sirohydrochlorin chelatase n=2 Tax=unclassified Thermosynechococcus TaxID=2622553 RepID=UPI0028732F6E|nr:MULTISPECIES: CbiX/SirB N-terminal domain-containing protein [unclassified Thermosynechococcus]WNC36342.1 CbiX/SirB N-terminal domain-containing protein [Thermosynechococcus sp. WL11]WNC38863.1 CbiX/SirB N-terminal domain-containing protein [Thermosynechococcus sp. WL17]WNC41385.1 CbiX/SirB N-terminal domain-containing protein [Thermosynechococcus sp. WL15]